MSDEQLSAAALAVLDALAVEPLTKRELARRLSMRATSLNGHLGVLSRQGRVIITNGLVALPGQLPEEDQRTAEERFHEQMRQLWQRRGIVAIDPTDVPDGYLRERLCLMGIALYGRRGTPR